MEILKAEEKEMQVLFEMFKITQPVKCEYCDKKITPENCGGFFPRFEDGNDKPIIICKSILCMSTYFTDNEDAIEKDANNDKHTTTNN